MVLKNPEYKEAELLKGVKDKNSSILKYLYQTMTPVIYQDVICNSGTEEEAKDLFQETMVIVIQNIRDEKYRSENLKGYIKTVARHLWYKKLRGRHREVSLPQQEDDQRDHFTYEYYLDLLAYEERIEKLRQALQQLQEPCYTIIRRFYYQKDTLQAIAEDFNWSYQYCKKRIYKCRNCLKQLIS